LWSIITEYIRSFRSGKDPDSSDMSIEKNLSVEILADPAGIGSEKRLLESSINTIALTNGEQMRVNAKNRFLV